MFGHVAIPHPRKCVSFALPKDTCLERNWLPLSHKRWHVRYSAHLYAIIWFDASPCSYAARVAPMFPTGLIEEAVVTWHIHTQTAQSASLELHPLHRSPLSFTSAAQTSHVILCTRSAIKYTRRVIRARHWQLATKVSQRNKDWKPLYIFRSACLTLKLDPVNVNQV
jgi:hypothetical protein